MDSEVEARDGHQGETQTAYAVAMKDGSPFGVASPWENWKSTGGEWIRIFAIITTGANEFGGSNPRPHAGHSASGRLRAVAKY
jgi:putative SOS response-associated peptidase YedK